MLNSGASTEGHIESSKSPLIVNITKSLLVACKEICTIVHYMKGTSISES